MGFHRDEPGLLTQEPLGNPKLEVQPEKKRVLQKSLQHQESPLKDKGFRQVPGRCP